MPIFGKAGFLHRLRRRPSESVKSHGLSAARLLALIYLAICLPTIVFLVLFRQPLGNPDELSHVWRAYQISKGVLLTEEALPGMYPKGMVEERWGTLNSGVHRRRFESLKTALPVFEAYDWSGKESLKRFNSSVYFPAAFIPQSVGLTISRGLGLNLVGSLQVASALNAIVCLLIIAWAIYLADKGRYLVALVGALPMTLHQMASASPDGLLIAASLLMFSLTTRSIARSTVSLPVLLGLAGLGAVTAATKLPYLMVGLAAMIALWRTDRDARRRTLLYALGCIVMVGVPLLWTKLSNAGVVKYSMVIDTDPGDQLAFLLANPLQIPGIAFSTLSVLWHHYLLQMIGVLGWMDAPLPRAAYVVLGAGLIATFALEGFQVQPFLRWLFLAGSALACALIFLSLYMIWTPLGSPGPILGVQGRYFLPILPFLLFLVPASKFLSTDKVKLSIFAACGVVGGIATVTTMIGRYYG
ncbi:DUF2142 domain-containing protein [Microvirga soli]|uniref:DUF2142 domain-containing protein n=1 Tax=Microvirga soli TaxID=1854496 RepID=UPI001FEB0526|nr:DUF2142 domain-containing protein [Microvirga soli]